jgi:transcriptional regulator with XRE-family HTH domain
MRHDQDHPGGSRSCGASIRAVKELRQAFRLSQGQLALRAGVSSGMIAWFETGRCGLADESCEKIRAVFQVLGGFDAGELDDYVHSRRKTLRGSPIISGMTSSYFHS